MKAKTFWRLKRFIPSFLRKRIRVALSGVERVEYVGLGLTDGGAMRSLERTLHRHGEEVDVDRLGEHGLVPLDFPDT